MGGQESFLHKFLHSRDITTSIHTGTTRGKTRRQVRRGLDVSKYDGWKLKPEIIEQRKRGF